MYYLKTASTVNNSPGFFSSSMNRSVFYTNSFVFEEFYDWISKMIKLCSQEVFICSNLTMETPDECVKSVQS